MALEFGERDELRWRDDDPDLVRRGTFPSPDATLAEGAATRDAVDLDVDGDGVGEVVLRVSPRTDPAPQNTAAGLVLVRHTPGGWRALVLVRGLGGAAAGTYGSSSGPRWGISHDGGRARLALRVEVMDVVEQESGHGHRGALHVVALRLGLRSDAVYAEGLCASYDGQPWRGRSPVCRCAGHVEYTVDGALRFVEEPHCRVCDVGPPPGRLWDREFRLDVVERAAPAWCRAFARSRPRAL